MQGYNEDFDFDAANISAAQCLSRQQYMGRLLPALLFLVISRV